MLSRLRFVLLQRAQLRQSVREGTAMPGLLDDV
jgi:hypothetical protein